jgi:3-deoxy-D-arabino-heptulosonate 7-phosphate (DAHP) synthase
VPVVKSLSHLPVIVDPSHATSRTPRPQYARQFAARFR